MKLRNLSLMVLVILALDVNAQEAKSDSLKYNKFIGSTLFVLFTPLLDPSPEYYQLNYGIILNSKNVVSIEAITWTYRGPLGRPYGPDYENQQSDFPGKVKAYGAGVAYKRFLWKGIYAQVHSTAFKQDYLDRNNKKIQSGFQLFNTLRFGYHLEFFRNRWFLEPSVAFTSWPINTNLPESFKVEENKWNKYFLFEPGLHFGFNFR